jgi:hypothetical protein
MDQAIPFVVLVAVGALLFFLLRRNESLPSTTAGEGAILPSPPGRGAGGDGTSPLSIPEVVAAPTPLVVETPQPLVPTASVPEPSPLVVQAPQPSVKPRKKRAVNAAPKPAEPTPIDTVVGLLKNKDTLATAFLLREIFDKPVSQRKEPRTK